ncbi:MAG TPA: hypothetical protein VFU30_10135 [Gaiellaceae bacterium]|nr:hypothetical protein [Gaiellaceae bacterium]
MGVVPTLRVSGFVAGVFILAVSAGCAGSSSHQSDSAGRSAAAQYAAMLMNGGSAQTVIHGVRVEWQREHDGHVCYTAKLPRRDKQIPLGSCIRRLRADEIAYAVRRVQKTHQLVIVGVAGPRVAKVYVRFRDKRWTPLTSRSAFFGYIPRGKVLSVVKVLKNGTRREFAVNQYSA